MFNINKQLKSLIPRNIKDIYVLAVFSVISLLLLASIIVPGLFVYSVFSLIGLLLALFLVNNRIELFIGSYALWVAFEPIILKYAPENWYVFLKYGPECLLYVICGFLVIKHYILEKKGYLKTPIDVYFGLFMLTCVISLFLNGVEYNVGILGIRQLIRFFAMYYCIIYSNLTKNSIKNSIVIIIAIALFESVLGIMQYILGGSIDGYLLPDRNMYLGSGILIEGVQQFWGKGQRIFATFGRYDRLGSFLALSTTIMIAYVYEKKLHKSQLLRVIIIFLLLIAAMLLTYSRATWLAVLAGLFVIGVLVKKDKRLIYSGIVSIIVMLCGMGLYLITTHTNVNTIIDAPRVSLVERVLEGFSRSSFEGSYYGYGRFYFMVNTPLKVVSQYPFFGVGPGEYGGGVAASLQNRSTYYELGLPFGISDEIGQIDNNWFSIWGETGSIGVLFYASIFIIIIRYSYLEYHKTDDEFKRFLYLASIGTTSGIIVIGFFAPYFEMKTLMIYYWILIGSTMSLSIQDTKKELTHINNINYR